MDLFSMVVIQCQLPKELNPQFHAQAAPTLVAFPLMGVGTDFTVPAAATTGNVASRSTLVPDECINPHPRNLTQNENMFVAGGALPQSLYSL